MLPLSDFVSIYLGQRVGCSGFSTVGQCVDLTCLWADNLGLAPPCDSPCNAIDWAGGSWSGWQWIANITGPNGNVPSAGDLVVFEGGCGYDVGDGHIAIVMPGATLSTIPVFEQNYAVPYCALGSHSYACCLGWQHPTAGIPSPTPTPTPTPTPSPTPTPTPSPTPIIVGSSNSDDLALLVALGLVAGGIALARSPRLRSRLSSDVSGLRRRLGQLG